MLVTTIENFVLFSTLLALGCFAIAWAAHHAELRGWWRPQPFTLTRLYAATLTLPPVAAAWLVAASLLPEWWLGAEGFKAAHSTPLHQLHLLSDLTAALEPRLAYATLLFVVATSFFAAWSSFRGYARVWRVVRLLEMNAALPPPEQVALVKAAAARHNIDVGLVMSDYPLSFVWGFRCSKLVLSSGLLHALTPDELTGVIEHETAHHARRDNSVKLALSLLAIYLWPSRFRASSCAGVLNRSRWFVTKWLLPAPLPRWRSLKPSSSYGDERAPLPSLRNWSAPPQDSPQMKRRVSSGECVG